MTILNIYSEISASLVLSIFLALIGGFFLLYAAIEEVRAFTVIGACLLAFGVAFGVFFVPTYQYYEVIVDNISQIDFNKFEIISQRGDIFVLKDLESVKYLWR